MGRPSKFTPEIAAAILRAVGAGLAYPQAAALAGVCERTLYNWLEAGDAGQEPLATFLQDLKSTEAKAELESLAAVKAGGPGWQSRAWYLERKYPERWGRSVRPVAAAWADAADAQNPGLIQLKWPEHSDA